jgi:hypothetical protein
MWLPHGRLLYILGDIQETFDFITFHVLEKVWIIRCTDELTTDPHVVVALFLHQRS